MSKKPTPSPADEADAQAVDCAVQAMINGPLSEWDHTRPLGSLNRADLHKLAVASISGFVLKRAAQRCSQGKSQFDQSSDVFFAE